MDIGLFKLEFVGTMWQISSRQPMTDSVLNQFRAHRRVVSVFYNPHNHVFFASFHANDLEEAKMIRDWVLEDVIPPDEQFTCNWDDELDAALYFADFDLQSWLFADDDAPHSPTGTFGWLNGFWSENDDDEGEMAA